MRATELEEEMETLRTQMSEVHQRLETCEHLIRRAVDRSWVLEREIARMARVLGVNVPDSV